MSILAPLYLLALSAPLPVADTISRGHHSVTHEFVFEASEWLSREHLVVYPKNGGRGLLELEAGVRFRPNPKYNDTLYFAPAEKWPIDPGLMTFRADLPLPKTEWPVGPIQQLPSGNPVTRALTTLRWTGVEDGVPVIALVKHETFDRHGNPLSVTLGDAPIPTDPRSPILLLLAGLGALGILGLWAVRLRSAA